MLLDRGKGQHAVSVTKVVVQEVMLGKAPTSTAFAPLHRAAVLLLRACSYQNGFFAERVRCGYR